MSYPVSVTCSRSIPKVNPALFRFRLLAPERTHNYENRTNQEPVPRYACGHRVRGT